jgi:ribonuclease HIII
MRLYQELCSMEDPRLTVLMRGIEGAGWAWRLGKPIAYGTQLIVSDGAQEATLDFYPKRGRCVIGGAESPLRRGLIQLTETDQGTPGLPRATKAASAQITGVHIGMDESGKGDWYGPLIVAAVYVDPQTAMALQRGGVRDSKDLDGASLPQIAALIERVVPAASRRVTVLDPQTYNRRYAGLGNINLLLAELYAETVASVWEATGCARIVCDQFAQRADRLERSFSAAGLPRPEQMHHAESASVAVAAASVLASAQFGVELLRLGVEAGLRGQLPAGASAIRALTAAAQHILAREGREGLGRYAKLNFKPVQDLLADSR